MRIKPFRATLSCARGRCGGRTSGWEETDTSVNGDYYGINGRCLPFFARAREASPSKESEGGRWSETDLRGGMLPRGYRAAFAILPVRMQRVQTFIRFTAEPTMTRTRWRLGSQRRLETLWAWLTRLPNTGALPQTSHIFAIDRLLK